MEQSFPLDRLKSVRPLPLFNMGWEDILTDPEDVEQVIADTSEPLFLVYYADVSSSLSASGLYRKDETDKCPWIPVVP